MVALASCKPSASSRLQPGAIQFAEAELSSVLPVRMKSSPHTALPIDRNARASGVGTPANAPTEIRNDSPMRTSSSM